MKKSDIVEQVVRTTTLSRSQAIDGVEAVFAAVSESLCKGENVYVRGFGTFKVRTAKERKARNIGKGTTVMIPAQRTAKLIISKQLKSRMNNERGEETFDF